MSERTSVQIPLEMTPELRDELDAIARLSGINSRMAVIRLACREYADRYWRERSEAERRDPRSLVNEAA